MSPFENPEPVDSSERGFHAVLRRVHAPCLDSLFWLALGCVLGWQDKGCVVQRHEQEGESIDRTEPSSTAGEP
jgi:hypothetical protein